MPILSDGIRFSLEFLWCAAQVCVVMKPNPASPRRAKAPEACDVDRAALDRTFFPMPSEVLGEIGLLVAVHLALAFAIVFTLQATGMD
jgi:hypothetical protein